MALVSVFQPAVSLEKAVFHAPFMSGGILTPAGELTEQDLYQAVHHGLVASALAVKLGMS